MKKIGFILLIFLTMIVLILACGTPLSASSKEAAYDKTAGLYQRQINEYTFLLKPINSEALYNMNYKNKVQSAEEIQKAKQAYDSLYCFQFEIAIEKFSQEITEYLPKGSAETDYEQLIKYYLFDMQNDLKLVEENGNITPCSVYLFERQFDLTKRNRFVVGFKRTELPQNTITFEYDNKYLNCGKLKFLINTNDFKN